MYPQRKCNVLAAAYAAGESIFAIGDDRKWRNIG